VLAHGRQAAQIWETTSLERIAELPGQFGGVLVGAFSPDSTVLATWSGSNPQPNLWESATGRRIATLKTSGQAGSVRFSGDSRTVLTFGTDSLARVWDAPTGAPLRSLAGFEPTSGVGMIGANGRRVVVISNDGRSRLWDGVGGRMLQFMGDREEAVKSACFGNDDRLLLTMNRNSDRVVLWGAVRGQRLANVESGTKHFQDVALSPDGEWFVTTYNDGSARLWPVQAATAAAERVSRSMTPDERDLYHLGADAERFRERLAWNADALAQFLLVASKAPLDAPGISERMRATSTERVAEFVESVHSRSPETRAAALAKVEEIINLQGGLAPMVRSVLADAFRGIGDVKRARRLLQNAGR
jgi:hypothetical protein